MKNNYAHLRIKHIPRTFFVVFVAIEIAIVQTGLATIAIVGWDSPLSYIAHAQETNIETDNDADIENDVDTSSDSGDNAIETSGEGESEKSDENESEKNTPPENEGEQVSENSTEEQNTEEQPPTTEANEPQQESGTTTQENDTTADEPNDASANAIDTGDAQSVSDAHSNANTNSTEIESSSGSDESEITATENSSEGDGQENEELQCPDDYEDPTNSSDETAEQTDQNESHATSEEDSDNNGAEESQDDPSTPEKEDSVKADDTTPPDCQEPPEDPCDDCNTEITQSNENDANVENTVSTDAQTGENTIDTSTDESAEGEDTLTIDASDTDGKSANAITTGDAVAIANVLNIINTNIIGSNWEQVIANIYNVETGDINLYELFKKLLEESGQPLPDKIVIENTNDVEITNDIETSSDTGNNAVTVDDGAVIIDTGDAAAISNVSNIANLNVIGHTWLLAIINVFGQWDGDLIVPGQGTLTIENPENNTGYTEIVNENDTLIVNNVTTTATTGDNSTDIGDGITLTQSGDALSGSSISTLANTNVIGSNWLFLLVNNMGSWIGNIINWDSETNSFKTVFQYAFNTVGENENCSDCPQSAVIHNSNTATIENNVSSSANTGNNSVDMDDGASIIRTGDALAWANIFNFINSNFIGNNWLFGIVNVFGQWNGNLEFAYPELQVSIDDGKTTADPGDKLTYTISYTNAGKADANNVTVATSFPKQLDPQSQSSEWKRNGHNFALDVGTLKAGASGSSTITLQVPDKLDSASVTYLSQAAIASQTPESDIDNNTDSDKTKVEAPKDENGVRGGFDYEYDYEDAKLEISRSKNFINPVSAGTIITHEITVSNDKEMPVYDIYVTEELRDNNNVLLGTLRWDVGDLGEDEEIIITYQAVVNNSMDPGEYIFAAQAEGEDPFDDTVKTNKSRTRLVYAPQAYVLANATPQEPTSADESQISQYIPEVRGVDEEACKELPIWILIAALIAYGLYINWALFPTQRREI